MKKGFTLIEVLAVVTIIGLIFVIAIPKIINSLNSKKSDIDNTTNNMIISAAKMYVNDHNTKFDKIEGAVYCLPLTTLTKEEYLDSQVKNVTDDKDITNIKSVKISYDNTFHYEIVNKKDCSVKTESYTELNYLESTGTQYIDTHTSLNQDSSVELEVQITNTERYNIFGSRSSAISNSFQTIISFPPYAIFAADFQNYEINRLNIKPSLNQIVIYISNKNLRIGDSIQQINEYTDFETPDNAFIFDVSGNPADGYQKAKMKLFYCKIYDNDTLVRDFIPVLDNNGVACLFDKVENKYYYNQGTGEFLYG